MYQFDLSADSESATVHSPPFLLLEYLCRVVVEDGVIVYSPAGKPVALNHAAARLCECSADKTEIGSIDLLEHVYSLFEISNEKGEAISKEDHPLALARRQETFSDYLVRLKDRGGNELKYILFNGDPICDESSNLQYFVIRMQDVTGEKAYEGKLEDETAPLRLLSKTIKDLLLSEDPIAFLDTVYRRLSDYLDLEVYFHFQVTEDGERLQLAAHHGVSEQVAKSLEYLAFGEAVCGTVAQTCSRIIAEEVQGSDDRLTAVIRELGITAYICHPLVAQGRLLGTLSFGTRSGSTFSQPTIELIRALSDQMAVALYAHELRGRTREISNKLVRAEEAERRRIARELHDDLGGDLSLLKQHLLSQERDNDKLIGYVNDLIDRVRHLTLDLRPVSLEEIGLVPAVQEYIDRFTVLTDIEVNFISEIGPSESVGTEKAVIMYRLIQEALTNVARHASTEIAHVAIHRDENKISVHIIDEGCGFDTDDLGGNGPSSGLQYMKERIELMNGTFSIDSGIDSGTHVSAVLQP